MYSNCLYNFEAFANKIKIPIAPQIFFTHVKTIYFTLYITLTLYFVLCLIVYSYTIAIAIANKYNSH